MALWDFSGRLLNVGVAFIVGIVLTRLLSPEEFGVFGIVIAIVTFSNVFLDFGFRIALIQVKEVTQTQLSTVFFLNLMVGLALFGLIAAAAKPISIFYDNAGLAGPLFTLSSLFLINSVALVPNVLLTRAMRFKAISIATTVAAALSGIFGIVLALMGAGVWALVAQSLTSAGVSVIGLWLATRWKPSYRFEISSIKPIRKLSGTVFFLTILDNFYSRLDVFIIGRMFSLTTVGFYNRAQSVDGLVRNFSVGTLGSIVLPYFSKIQDDEGRLRQYYGRSIHLVLFISFLLSGALFLGSMDIIVILFTEKWASVASYFRIIALTSFVYPISVIMVTVIVARGNSREFIKLEILKRLVLAPGYVFLIVSDIYSFLIAQMVLMITSVNLNAYFVQKEIGFPMSKTGIAVGQYALLAIGCGAFSFAVTSGVAGTYLLHLPLTVLAFSIPYFATAYYFELQGLTEALSKVRELVLERKTSQK